MNKKQTTALEEYEAEEKTYKTHGPEKDTLGEAIHRSVKDEMEKPERDAKVDAIQSGRARNRHWEHR